MQLGASVVRTTTWLLRRPNCNGLTGPKVLTLKNSSKIIKRETSCLRVSSTYLSYFKIQRPYKVNFLRTRYNLLLMLSGASRLPSCHATQSTNQEAEDVRFTFASAFVQNNFRFALKSTKGLFDLYARF